MNDDRVRCFSYPLMGWPFPAVLVVAPVLGTIAAIAAFAHDHAYEWFIVAGVAVLCGAAAYFYYPVEIRIGESSIGVRYLFGPTLWFNRDAVTHGVTFTGNVVKLRIRDGRFLTRLIGVFLFAVPLMRGTHELLHALDKR